VTGTSWALYILAMRRDWQARVAVEAQACKGEYKLDRLPITRRVVQEVLRLYPPAPMLVRSANHDLNIGGFDVRRGQPVAVSIYAMHRHHLHWDRPDEFHPDRFGQDQAWPIGYLPFGIGPRVCIAAQFAMAEICVVVARLLAEFSLSPGSIEPVVNLQITTRSSTGLNVFAEATGVGSID
jgi:cytochrome P450